LDEGGRRLVNTSHLHLIIQGRPIVYGLSQCIEHAPQRLPPHRHPYLGAGVLNRHITAQPCR